MFGRGVNFNEIRITGGTFRNLEYFFTLFGITDEGWILLFRLDGD